MSTYVMGDIHGEYDLFMDLLDRIGLKETDTLYLLGDLLDRGPHPIRVMRKVMEMPNVRCLLGNHEWMALDCLEFLSQEITERSIKDMDSEIIDKLLIWQYNGNQTTLDEFRGLDPRQKREVIDFIRDCLLYEQLTVNGQEYLLVHAGLGHFAPDKPLSEYEVDDLVWERPDYSEDYFDDIFVITGHTPTQLIEGNPNPGYIYRKGHYIVLDCGACFLGGRLAAICLETGEEFYSSR